jgi:hypothetical protein
MEIEGLDSIHKVLSRKSLMLLANQFSQSDKRNFYSHIIKVAIALFRIHLMNI